MQHLPFGKIVSETPLRPRARWPETNSLRGGVPWAPRFPAWRDEAVLLLLVCLSPWTFGAVHPLFEALVYAGLAVTLLLWATAILAGWQLRWQNCPVALTMIRGLPPSEASHSPLIRASASDGRLSHRSAGSGGPSIIHLN
jgi:hypothetical protein